MLAMLLDELWKLFHVSRNSSARERGCRGDCVDEFADALVRSVTLWDVVNLRHQRELRIETGQLFTIRVLACKLAWYSGLSKYCRRNLTIAR